MGRTLQPPSPADRVRGETLLPAGPLGSLQRLPGSSGGGDPEGEEGAGAGEGEDKGQ